MDIMNECVIEWIKGQKTATITMPSNTRLNNKLRNLAQKTPTIIEVENKDGSILAHVPESWIKIVPPKELSDAQRSALVERAKANFGHNNDKAIQIIGESDG